MKLLPDWFSGINWNRVGDSAATYGCTGTCAATAYSAGQWLLLLISFGLAVVKGAKDIPETIDFWRNRNKKRKQKRVKSNRQTPRRTSR